jgi:NADH:ubiquinone oxidoreductase subunit K
MFLEIMLLAINFITFSIYLDALLGQMFVLYILTVACYIIVYRISYFSCFFFELKKLD